MSSRNKPKLPNLEESLTEISQLIEKMETNEQSLEQSLHHFERGITLIKHCQKILSEAEQKVQLLVQNQEQESLVPFSSPAKDEDPIVETCAEIKT